MFHLERDSGACQSRNSSQRVCDSVTAAHARRSRRLDYAMRPPAADAPPAGLPTPAPSHTHTTCSGSAAPTHAQHAQAMRTDVCRPPTAGHGAGAARRPGAQQPAPAHQRSAGAMGWRGRRSAGALGWRGRLPPSPPHNTVVVRRGEGTGRSTAAHPAEARCDTPPLRPPPVHAKRAAPATPSSTPAWGAPLRVEGTREVFLRIGQGRCSYRIGFNCETTQVSPCIHFTRGVC